MGLSRLRLGIMNEKATSNEATEVYARAGRTTPQSITPEETVVLDATTEQFPTANSRSTSKDYQTTSYPVADYQATDYDYAYDYPEAEPLPPETPVQIPPAPAQKAKRGTLDFGLFILRLAIGTYLILSAVSTFFQLGSNQGIPGLQADYQTYLYPQLLAIVVPVAQLASGVFLLIGLLTPVAAAVATVITSFTALHSIDAAESFSFLNPPETVWLGFIAFGAVLALQFTGPGNLSLDFGRSWALRPLASSWLFVLIGLAGAAALWWFCAGVNPLA